MAQSNDLNDVGSTSLSNLFNEGLELYNKICNSNEPTNSSDMQLNVKSAMRLLEQATRLVSLSDIFSKNEGIEEVSTNNLQFFLLPVLLGMLSMKLTSGDRKEVIVVAEVYFKDFLQRCNDYNLSSYDVNKEKKQEQLSQTEVEQITTSVTNRSNKIQRFREQKELKEKLVTLKQNMDTDHTDEEIKRSYFITMLRSFVHEAISELESIEMEKPILDHMSKIKKDDKPEPRRPVQHLKPIIITKDEVQKAVFGAGYPSMATMTVQEFYDKRVQDGVFPDPNKAPTGQFSLQQAALAGVELFDDEKDAADEETQVDQDDPEKLDRMRSMDEYKDEHRRGWGNRMNRS